MQIQLTKIPSLVRRLNIPHSVDLSQQINANEGEVLVAKVLAENGKKNTLEFTTGRIGFLVEGDVLPVVLGKRRAMWEYSGDIPSHVSRGDILHFICESGVVGKICGINEAYGEPLAVEVLGSLLIDGKPANIKHNALPRTTTLADSVPIIGFAGTCMSIGKTTAMCKIIKYFKKQELKVAAVKLSGIASAQDLDVVADAGADPVLGFMDAGLPSTCLDANEAVDLALGILQVVNESKPDLILAEFGDGIIGEYHVGDILRCHQIQQCISSLIVGAGDFAGVWGAQQIMREYGMAITSITGPVVNNDTNVHFIESHFKLRAESNQHMMPKTLRLIEKDLRIFDKTKRSAFKSEQLND